MLLHYTALLTLLGTCLLSFSAPALAAENGGDSNILHVTTHPGAIFCLVVFLLSYVAVLFEEKTHLKKSKPVMLGAGIIWITIGVIAKDYGVDHHVLKSAILHGLEEYGSLLLFLPIPA